MATVTGKTSEKIDELMDASVVSGGMDSNGQMSLETRGGTVISMGSTAGLVVGGRVQGGKLILELRDDTDIEVASAVDLAWPVGSIFISAVSTNPSTLLGGGVWTRFAKGRMLMSLDETQAEFDTVEETGGSKTHTLTEAEMPPHTHNGTTASSGAHTHDTRSYGHTNSGASATGSLFMRQTPSGADATYDITSTSAGSHTHSFTTQSTGGGQAFSQLPPYINVYMWKRTA